MSEVVQLAEAFARSAHESMDQRRKYSGEPYIVHPAAVAAMVASVTDDDELIAAAWLHDVVEDTPVTVSKICGTFGERVAALVAEVTNPSKPNDGNRRQRKAIDREHLSRASPGAKTIKLADLIDNLTDLATLDPGFASVYLDEKKQQLEILAEGDQQLYQRAREVLQREFDVLSGTGRP